MKLINTIYRSIGCFLLLIPSTLLAVEYNLNDSGVLAHGYDVVSYFDGDPEPGSSSYAYEVDGFTLYFSSDNNRQRFQKDPERYTPSFGGYCSYGVRMGKKLDIDPMAYAIENDRLYLLLDRSTKTLWDKDRKRNIGIAERLWPGIRSVTAKELEGS